MKYTKLSVGRLATFTITTVSGKPAADGGVLQLRTELELGDIDPSSGDIRSVRFKIFHGELGYLGRSDRLLCQLSRFPETWKHGKMVGIPISQTTLTKLDSVRTTDGNLRLEITSYAEVDTSDGPIGETAGNAFTLKSAEWLGVLDDMEWLETVSVDFPLGGAGVPSEWQESVEEYGEAVRLFRQGEYAEAMTRCRRSMEVSPTLPPDNPSWDKTDKRTEWDWPQRVKFAIRGVRNIFHTGAHHTGGRDPQREEARMVLTMMGAILQYGIRKDTELF